MLNHKYGRRGVMLRSGQHSYALRTTGVSNAPQKSGAGAFPLDINSEGGGNERGGRGGDQK